MKKFDPELYVYFFEKAKKAIMKIKKSEIDDTYVISFFFDCYEQDMRYPQITIGYNTESQYRKKIPKASDADEARWNYAFWLQNELTVLGGKDRKTQKWIKSLDYYYTDEEDEEDADECTEKGSKICELFVDAAIKLAKELRSSGVIREKFARELPIIIHEH